MGDRVHISGPVGSGKSTLVKYLAAGYNTVHNDMKSIRFSNCMYTRSITSTGLDFLDDHSIDITDEKFEIVLRKLGILQDVAFIPDTDYFFDGGLIENVLYPLQFNDLLKGKRCEINGIEVKSRAFVKHLMEKLLRDLGLNHLLQYESKFCKDLGKSVVAWSSVLSSGEKCLLSIVRALIKKPTLVICDNFPVVHGKDVLKLFEEHCSTSIITSCEGNYRILSTWCDKEIKLG